MSYIIEVENIKCGGCANTIKSKISLLEGVNAITVGIEDGAVHVDASDDTKQRVSAELLRLGYPEKGTAEGLKAATAKAKSFVSCAVGRLETNQ